MRRTPSRILLALLLLTPLAASAQWQLLDSNTTADLRGIDNVGGGVAWASGTNGTVLRTVDGGATWQVCAVPPGAEKLDFRGVQAFDAKTAIVMSSGPGDQSRLYKTIDGCRGWKLILTNHDKDGFWDAFQLDKRRRSGGPRNSEGELLGDPVNGKFVIYSYLADRFFDPKPFWIPTARPHEAAFAASNSAILSFGWVDYMLGTGGVHGSRVIFFHDEPAHPGSDEQAPVMDTRDVPVSSGSDSAGIFSLAMRDREHIVAVGGDYLKPNDSSQVAAFTEDKGNTWASSESQPHGYRSAVAYDAKTKTWITVGPNGTDISTDDGRNWRALHPIPALHDTPGADRNWNALSLPFVVGPHGRIGLLEPSALPTASH